MKRLLTGIGFAALAATALVLSPSVRAAPQILGLVASAEPIKLSCENGHCTAELSSFCLQAHRKAPHPGTAYLPAKRADLSLVVTADDGTTKTFPAKRFVRVASLRSYATVSISLPESTLRALGGNSAAIKVGRLAAIVPVARPTDAVAMSADEIANFTGPVRAIADGLRDSASAAMVAVRLSNTLINALPMGRPASDSQYQEIWDRSVRNLPPGNGSAKAIRYLKREYSDCRFVATFNENDPVLHTGVRTCLEGVHDEFMQDFTEKVWKAIGAGS